MKCTQDKEGNFTLSQFSHSGRLTNKQGASWLRGETATISIVFASLPGRCLVPKPQNNLPARKWQSWLESEKWKSLSFVWLFATPRTLLSPWNSPGQNTGVGNLSLLQGIFPTHGSNAGLPHCRQILYQLSHKGSPRILEWVAYPFSGRSSQPRNWTMVSYSAGGFFTNWDIREAPKR